MTGHPGELVITRPMPSMPLYFWNDPDGSRFRDSYFSTWPGVWRHGDLVEFDDDGSSVILGRSDSTLNRNGIRMGPADIYRVVESLPEVREALVVGVEEDGGYYMPLFVHLQDDVDPDEAPIASGPPSARRSRPATCPTTSSRSPGSRTRAPARSSRCRSSDCSRAIDWRTSSTRAPSTTWPSSRRSATPLDAPAPA